MIKKSIIQTIFNNYCLSLLFFTFLFSGIVFNINSTRSQTVVNTISIGPEAGSGFAPSQVVVNPTTNLVYISNLISDSITVMDCESNKVLDNIKIEKIGRIAINPVTNRIYIVTLNGISVIDGKTNDIITTIPTVRLPGWPIGVNPTTNSIYVFDRGINSICVIDGKANTIVKTIALNDEDAYPVRISVNSITNRIYVTCQNNNVLVIDGKTNRTIDIVKVRGRLLNLVVNPLTNLIYVQSNPLKDENSCLKVIDGKSNQVINEIKLEGYVGSIDININTNCIYATIGNESEFGMVNVIDCESNRVVNTVTVGVSPDGIAVNTIADAVYVANMQNDSVSVIDGTSNKPLETIQIGEKLYGGIGINYETNRIYIGSWSSNAIFVIDGNTDKVIDVIKTAISSIGVPSGVGVNPTTNRIYVAIGNDDVVAVIDGTTNEVIKYIKHKDFSNVRQIGVNHITNRIYVTGTQGVGVIDGNINSITDFIRGVDSATEIGVNPETNTIYVIAQPNNLKVIDGKTNNVIDKILLYTFTNAEGIAVNSITNRIYVGSFIATTGVLRLNSDGTPQQSNIAKMGAGICVINGKTNKAIDCSILPVSTVIGVNPTTNHIYTANLNSISVIDGTNNKFVSTIEVENGKKQAIGVNPLRNLIYVTNPDSGNVTVIKDDI